MAEEALEMLDEMEDTQRNKYLTFTVGREDYGIEIRFVTEIIVIQTITEVPELPNYVRGIINLRGKIIPLMDIRLRFKKEFREYDERTCIIVVDIKDITIGLIVDRVNEVLNIPEEEVVEPPKIENEAHNKYIKGIGKVGGSVKLILNCQKLLNEGDSELLSEIAS